MEIAESRTHSSDYLCHCRFWLRLGTSTTFTANRISWVPHGQGGGSLARSLADSKCRRRAKGKGQRHGSWRSRIRARFGNDDSVAYSRGDKERESRDFYFLSWFGLVLSWKKLGGLERRKGRCHVGWRTSRIISQMEAGPFGGVSVLRWCWRW